MKNDLKDFIKILRNIKKISQDRKNILNNIFWEYENYNIDLFEDRDSKLEKYISEKKSYPNAFLGSTLGFNKSNMESRFNMILGKFKLDKKPKVASVRNSIEFEKLKLLILIYFNQSK